VKNRKREICTSGSVRGRDGNVPTYSAGRPDIRKDASGGDDLGGSKLGGLKIIE
jgi:hypothetical protein